MDNIHQHNKLSNLSQPKLSPKSHHSPKTKKITPEKYINDYSPIQNKKSPRDHLIKYPTSISAQYVNQKQHIQSFKPTANPNLS